MKYDEKQRRIMYEDQLKEYERSGGNLTKRVDTRGSTKDQLKLIVVINIFVLIFMSGSHLVRDVQHIYFIHSSSGWPNVQGVMKFSTVSMWKPPKGGPHYCSSVRYEYVVNGKTYNGHHIEFYDYCAPASFAQTHPEDSKIKVYFDPKNPLRSALVVDNSLAEIDIKNQSLWVALWLLVCILLLKKFYFSGD